MEWLCDLLYLASFTYNSICKVHPGCVMYLYFVPCYGWIIVHCMDGLSSLSVHPLTDIWIVSTFWLLWIMLPWTFTYKFLCEPVFSSFEYILRSGFAFDSMFSFFRKHQTISTVAALFYISPATYEGSNLSTSFPTPFKISFFSWLHWVFVAPRGLSLVAGGEGYSLQCVGFSLQWQMWAWAPERAGVSSYGSWALESRLSSCRAGA